MKQLNVRIEDELFAQLNEVDNKTEFIKDAITEKLGKPKHNSQLISIEAMLDEKLAPFLELLNKKPTVGGNPSNSSVLDPNDKISQLKSQLPNLRTANEITYEDVY